MGDHTETIRIEYDPTQITYAKLLEVFWEAHQPQTPSWSRQYMSIIFYHGEEQRQLALTSKAQQEADHGRIYTEIRPAGQFYLAEDYHQKYYLRQNATIVKDYRHIYLDWQAFTASAAVTKVNGYLMGYESYEAVAKQLPLLGLSEAGQTALLNAVKRQMNSGHACPVK